MPVVRVFVNSIFVLLPDEGLLYIVFLSLLPDGELEGHSILSKKKGFIEWSLSLRAISLCNKLILYNCLLVAAAADNCRCPIGCLGSAGSGLLSHWLM